ncbi:MAG: glycosyltransferase [Bacteroidales bacterium]|nr:glycosyltransferase [Bacteroidales bacterium]
MDISIVVPLYNEEESLQELVSWVGRVSDQHKLSYEIVMIDDGSIDNSWKLVEEMSRENQNIVGIKFRRNYGKSAALQKGFEVARGDVVITMDADLQDSPDEIPELYRMIKEDGFDLVSGWKKKRHDPISKTLPSKLYNGTVRKVTGIYLHDMNCGLKAYRKAVIKSIEVYGEMHRYIPVIAKWAGFNKIGEKVVQHRERQFGTSKYGLERYVRGFLDLMSVTFVGRFGRRPMHFFGTWGTVLFMIGFGIAGYLAFEKIFLEVYKMTERPLFYLGMLAMVIGSQMFLTGFIAEMITRNAHDRNRYLIECVINVEKL